MKHDADVLIIGAGILGCFAARNLSRFRISIDVIEKNCDVCSGITRANTGIIYPGYDQHPGSLKASLCVRASAAFPELCRELDVPYRKCGLLMLSFGPKGDGVLAKKIRQSEENGVEGVRLIGPDEVCAMEPRLRGGVKHALYAENACVVNPWELGIAAFENAVKNGVSFYFGQEAVKIRRTDKGFSVDTEDSVFNAKRVLICAGLHSDAIWETVSDPKVRLVPKSADYIVLDTCAGDTISHVISVESEEKGKGLTLVPTVNGNILIGPTKRDACGENERSTNAAGLDELVRLTRELIPSMPVDQIIRNFGTARPNPYLVEENGALSKKSLNDFVILEEDGLFDLIGIKTPGITCANELGTYIAERIIGSFEKRPETDPDFEPVRTGIKKSASPDNYEIVCRCRQVSKAEVLEAVRRGAVSVDGVKRRTGAGMGRCQGGYCEEKIMHILSSELGVDVTSVTKDGAGSEIIAGL